MAKRLQAMGQPNYAAGFELTLQLQMLEHPLQWRRPLTIFVNSMSDLFHAGVPLDFIQRVFDVMRRAQRRRFQVLQREGLLPWSHLKRKLLWPRPAVFSGRAAPQPCDA